MFQDASPIEEPWQRQRLRVPREDGTLFARPELRETPGAVERNAAALNAAATDIQGRTLQHMRDWARRRTLEAAVDYTRYLAGETIDFPIADDVAFVADGHQPSLFHPGVWVKNFGIHGIAERTGRRALHLVVDNDTLSSSSLRVPAGDRSSPRFESLAFDDERRTGPWEDAGVRNEALFCSFGDRAVAAMRRWGVEPLIGEIWPTAVEFARRGGLLRDCFTAARHRLEEQWGLHNLEVPLSRLCGTEPFLWFASHLFAHAARFREVHNLTLQQFRTVNRVRSRTHPVPELSQQGDWIESPFWIWSEGESIRRRAFVRQATAKQVELTDCRDLTLRFPLAPQMDACCAVELLRELPAKGVRLRTRALTTTLFARLCLADLFVHGIGGAKYDEMTDRIIARFFGIAPPAFLTLSATLHLPLAEPFNVAADDLPSLRQRLRDLRYNSDRHLPEGTRADALIDEKRRLIEEQQAAKTEGLPRRLRRERSPENHRRFLRFRELDRQLAEFTQPQQQRLLGEIEVVRSQLQANAVLQNREFAFCLYPEEALRPFLTGLWNRDDE